MNHQLVSVYSLALLALICASYETRPLTGRRSGDAPLARDIRIGIAIIFIGAHVGTLEIFFDEQVHGRAVFKRNAVLKTNLLRGGPAFGIGLRQAYRDAMRTVGHTNLGRVRAFKSVHQLLRLRIRPEREAHFNNAPLRQGRDFFLS